LENVAILGISAAALFGWWHYYPKSPLIARLGLVGDRANTQRDCGRNYRLYRWARVTAWIPTGDVVCASRRGFADSWTHQDVNVDPFTRRVTHAQRMMVPVDSLSWEGTLDSIRTAMSIGGGTRIPCYAPYGKEPPWIASQEAWRFEGYTVRLASYRWLPPWTNANGPPPWLLQLDGYRNDPPNCG
jgi:hypothetical protein